MLGRLSNLTTAIEQLGTPAAEDVPDVDAMLGAAIEELTFARSNWERVAS